MFFQLVSHRYERGSMLVTSNRSVSEWGTVFGDPYPSAERRLVTERGS
ncbi:ATP-binding protein [Azospirillum argentinense]